MAAPVNPIIRICSAAAWTGPGTPSDSAASGAGPDPPIGSAISGNGTTSGTGALITVPNANLGGVSTLGDHALYFADGSTGQRNFVQINSTANSGTATAQIGFTAGQTLRAGVAGAWAVGGARATLENANTRKLFNNNNGAGDAMGGWRVRCLSGHTETLTVPLQMLRNGDVTGGAIVLEGDPNATVMPILNCNYDGNFIYPNANFLRVANLCLRKTSGANSVSYAVNNAGVCVVLTNLLIDSAGGVAWRRGLNNNAGGTFVTLRDSTIAGCAGEGVNSQEALLEVVNCDIRDGQAQGLYFPGPAALVGGGTRIANCLIRNNASYGVWWTAVSGTYNLTLELTQCTLDGNLSGLALGQASGTAARMYNSIKIDSNIFSYNSQYGITWLQAGITWPNLDCYAVQLRGNNYYLNSSGWMSGGDATYGDYLSNLDPQYTDRSGGNFTVTNPALMGLAYPPGATLPVGTSATRGYSTAGCAQPQPGGGRTLFVPVE